MDNGLWRASIVQQGYHNHNELLWFAQTLKHGPLMGAERLSAPFAFVSLALLSMTDDVACSAFPSCRTVQIRAKCQGRIFPIFCTFHTLQNTDRCSFQNPTIFPSTR